MEIQISWWSIDDNVHSFSIAIISNNAVHMMLTGADQADLLMAFFMHQEFALNALETLSAKAPNPVMAVSTKSPLKKFSFEVEATLCWFRKFIKKVGRAKK